MILQTLKILSEDLEKYLYTFDNEVTDSKRVVVGNIAFREEEKYHPNSVENTIDDKIVMTLVRVEEESSLKNNLPLNKRNPSTTLDYHSPKVQINLYVLISCNSFLYENAMTNLSRVIRFFQTKNVFSELNTAPVPSGINKMDQFDRFKIMAELYAPTFEEANHLWSMMGGKQLPFVMYKLKTSGLEYKTISSPISREEIPVVDKNNQEEP